MPAVNELRAQFHRRRKLRIVNRQDAAADAFARFEDQRLKTAANQVARRREAGCSRTEDDYLFGREFHSLSF
jgi:hypothetical protein